MSLDAAIAQCQALLAAHDHQGLNKALRALEDAKPSTQVQWDMLVKLFLAVRRPAQAQLMTERFLAVDPDNLAAQMERVSLIADIPHRREEAQAMAQVLAARPFDQPAQLLTLAKLLERCHLHKQGLKVLERAKAADPSNPHIRFALAHIQVGLQNPARARSELAQVRKMVGGNIPLLLTAATMALWFDDQALARSIIPEVEPLIEASEGNDRAFLVLVACRLQQWDVLARHLDRTDFRRVGFIPQLEEIYRALEGRGYDDAERRITAAALAIDPEDDNFYRRAEARTKPRSAFLAAVTAPAPAPPPRPGLFDRLRSRLAGR